MKLEVSAVLLAAGMSSRMGSCKQLLPLGGRPFVVRCLDSINQAGIKDVVVVVGACLEDVVDAVCSLPVRIVVNPDPDSDMASSARLGVKAVSRAATGVFVCLSDHPLVSPGTYRSLMLRHAREPEAILVPVHAGRKGHPTLFPYRLLDGMTETQTLRDVIGAHPELIRLVDVPDGGVTVDIDTPEDYKEAARSFA